MKKSIESKLDVKIKGFDMNSKFEFTKLNKIPNTEKNIKKSVESKLNNLNLNRFKSLPKLY